MDESNDEELARHWIIGLGTAQGYGDQFLSVIENDNRLNL
jgi:hypothetical protein